MEVKHASTSSNSTAASADHASKKGMILPFQPLSLAFDHINYFVDMPGVSSLFYNFTRHSLYLFH